MKKMKIALIGYGYWGKTLLPYLDARFDVEFVFGRSLKPHGRFTNDLQTILDSDTIAVVVATPIDAHYEVARDVLLSGKHVLCEKPLALHASEAEDLAQLARSRGLNLLTDFTYSFSNSLTQAASFVHAGEIGDLRYINMQLMREVTSDRQEGFTTNQLLASKFAHLLAALSLFVDISSLKFGGLSTPLPGTGVLQFEGSVSGQLLVSIKYPQKHMGVQILGTIGRIDYSMESDPSVEVISYRSPSSGSVVEHRSSYYNDESNGLSLTVDRFSSILGGAGSEEDNLDLAVEVTKVLEASCGLG